MNLRYIVKFIASSTLISLVGLIFYSCKKLAEVAPPVSSINGDNVYSADATATSVLTGIYTNMSKSTSFAHGNNGISYYCGLSADEWTLYSGVTNNNAIAYYRNALIANGTPSSGSDFWNLYTYVFTCNAAIEGLTSSSFLTPTVKQQLLGEAKFMRAFLYFYLVNLFGDVPLINSTNYDENMQLPRASQNEVWTEIIDDLRNAKSLLSEDFLNGNLQKYSGTPERVRPTKWAAIGLLARAYLFVGDWANAEVQASEIINASSLFKLSSINNTFLKASLGNNEAIWQIQPTVSGHNTEDGWLFILPSTGPDANSSNGHPVYLSSNLLNSFEPGDQRKVIGNWVKNITVSGVTYYYPNKYKIATLNASVNEYLMILRLGEQYLIRAEARAQQNNISGAQNDLNAIRSRAGLQSTVSTDKQSLLLDIFHERQVELFTEWGNRWLDLKRTKRIEAVMSLVTPQKANGGAWESYQQLYPIPLSDILKNVNLQQNYRY